MLIRNIISESFGLISKQLQFYCLPYGRNLETYQEQELIKLLIEHQYERLADSIELMCKNNKKIQIQRISKILVDHCFKNNRISYLIKLIQKNLIDINVRLDNYGRTLLHRCAFVLNVELVSVLINCNVDVRVCDMAGNTALHVAIQSYRNGVNIFDSGPILKEKLSTIIELLLKSDLARRQHENSIVRQLELRNSNLFAVSNIPISKSRLLRNINKDSHNRPSVYPKASCNLDNENVNNLVDVNQLKDEALKLPVQFKNQNSKLNTCKSVASSNLESVAVSKCNNHVNLFTQKDDLKTLSIHRHQFNHEKHQQLDSMNISNSHLKTSISPNETLLDAKNLFGRTALHYCVLLIAENHLCHFIELLLGFGADANAVDNKLKTPFYHLVKRPDIDELITKCDSMNFLLAGGCDHLGLSFKPFHKSLSRPIDPKVMESYVAQRKLEMNNANLQQQKLKEENSNSIAPPIQSNSYKRICELKHLARVVVIRNEQNYGHQLAQLPEELLRYISRKLIDQGEFI